MTQADPPTQIVAQLVPDTDAPDLGPLLVVELAKRSGCPSFGGFLAGHPECSECLIRRACEARLALNLFVEVDDLARLDNIAATAGVGDLMAEAPTTGTRMPAAVKRAMGKKLSP